MRVARWLPWLTGVAALALLVLVVLHSAEERAFLRLLQAAEPRWLVWAALFQLSTYVAQAEVWRIVLHRAGRAVPQRFALRLSLAKLFMDQAVPSMGLSGAALVAHSLERRGVPRVAVMSAIAVDSAAFYLAYVGALALALVLLVREGHAIPLILVAGVAFAAYATALTVAVLDLAGGKPGRLSRRLTKLPGLGRIVGVLQDASPRLARDPSLLVRGTGLQLLVIAADAATLWTLLRAVGTATPPGAVFASFMLASVVRSVGVLPGGLGSFEIGAVGALTLVGVPSTAALSAALIFRVMSFWLPMLPGLAFTRSISRLPAAPNAAADAGEWWTIDAEQVLAQTKSSAAGLSTEEAARRLAYYGPNVVGATTTHTRLSVLWGQLRSPLLLLLLFAAATSVFTREWADAAIVILIVLTSVGIGYTREYRAQTAAARLGATVQVQANVLRDGEPRRVPLREVVPGDVALLAAGSIVPGDARVLAANDCYLNESALTGESFPVAKKPGVVAADTPLAKRSNSVHLGTSVRSGTCTCLVLATGPATSYGEVAHRLASNPPETEFDRGVRHFGYMLTVAMTVMMVVVLAANLLLHRPFVDTLLFAVALAVGLSPELLPAILSVNLARGAQTMSQHGVLVRRLNAIENLGSMDVLCTDKTGTLTEGVVRLDAAYDGSGNDSDRVLDLAAANAALQSGLANPLDEAILQRHRPAPDEWTKLGEVPYDFERKRLSVAARRRDGPCLLITKGAVDTILAACSRLADGAPLDECRLAELRERSQRWLTQGIRVLGLASRSVAENAIEDRDAEREMTFEGFLTFVDRPKAGVDRAISDLERLGVAIKVITGDAGAVAVHVASRVGLSARNVLTGTQVDALDEDALTRSAEEADLFVEVSPGQKERVIAALRRAGHVVGFLGDGINDAPAMHAADTSLSVEGAVDVAREAADFVLLERDLDVIRRGIEEGRRTFANTLKYVMTTTSANLGNMISMAVASLVLPFLPLLASQILLNNFLSDIPAVGLADDAVDPEMVEQPRRWNLRFLARFMVDFGCLSSLFDALTFALLLVVFASPPELFRTGWFVESLLTELVIALVVRTRRPFWRSRPSPLLLWSSVALIATAFAIPYVPGSQLLGFTTPGATLMLALAGITVTYVAAAEALKARFYRREARQVAPRRLDQPATASRPR